MSGLYNMLFGVNKFSHVLLRMLDISPLDVPRFRDCYLNEDDEIVIFTRTGGGNREEYEAQNEALRRRPGFIGDEDDSLDRTYAKFRYAVPKDFAHVLRAIKDVGGGVDDPTAKFKDLLAKLESKDTSDPLVRHALDVGKKIIGDLNTVMEAGGGVVLVGDDDKPKDEPPKDEPPKDEPK